MLTDIIERIIAFLDKLIPLPPPPPLPHDPDDLSRPHYTDPEQEFGESLLGMHYSPPDDLHD